METTDPRTAYGRPADEPAPATGWHGGNDSTDPWRRPEPGQQPTTGQPTTGQPTTQQPTNGQPTFERPTVQQPTTEEPTAAGASPTGYDAPAFPPVAPTTQPSPGGPFGTFPPAGGPTQREGSGGGRKRTVATTALVALLAGVLGGAAGAAIVNATNDDNNGTSGPVVSSLADSNASGASNSSSSAADNPVEAVATAVLPSVVSISVTAGQLSGTGTGVIISSDGNILTNNHVVGEAADGGTVVVNFQDGTSAEAEIVGTDPLTDLAVIKVDKSGLTAAQFGKSSDLRVGQEVVAIGSPLGLAGTVTTGIVSALQRPVVTSSEDSSANSTNTVIDAIQTDAAINPGNSGGPLVDMQGRVVGINSAIASLGAGAGGQAGSIGLGFSIPIDQARDIAQELIDNGKATHALLGVSVGTVQQSDGAQSGALISATTSGGAAEQAGLQAGDVVTKLGDRVISDPDSLVAGVRSYRPGDKVTLEVQRDGNTQTIEVTLGSDANSQ